MLHHATVLLAQARQRELARLQRRPRRRIGRFAVREDER